MYTAVCAHSLDVLHDAPAVRWDRGLRVLHIDGLERLPHFGACEAMCQPAVKHTARTRLERAENAGTNKEKLAG
jgi:hypothetical protein